MNEGRNLWNAIDLIERAGNEIESMKTELLNKLSSQLDELGNELGFKVDQGKGMTANGDSGWVRFSSLSQWGIRGKDTRINTHKDKKYTGNLSVSIVLNGDDEDEYLKIPRVEVAYLGYDEEDPIDASSMSDAGTWLCEGGWDWLFPKSTDSQPIWRELPPIDRGESWDKEVNWIFAIPLFSINSVEDINELIVEPTIGLLKGSSAEQVFATSKPLCFALGYEGAYLKSNM